MDNNEGNRKYDGEKWKTMFTTVTDVNAKCKVLDQVSNTVFNTLTGDIVMGFFSFGATWWNALNRSVLNWWNNAKRYKNLHALWQDVTKNVKNMENTINSACGSIIDEKDQEETINLVKNCVRLTMALCARTYQLEDARGRWNQTIRRDAYQTLVKTSIKTKEGNSKWFDFLWEKIPTVKGKMAPFLTSKDSSDLNKELQRRTTTVEIINTASDSKKTENNKK